MLLLERIVMYSSYDILLILLNTLMVSNPNNTWLYVYIYLQESNCLF